MRDVKLRMSALIFVLAAIVFLGACHHKPAPPPPPPPPAPAAPTAALTASPATVDKGQSSTLSWQTSNATDVSIDNGIGAVQPNGSQTVNPSDTTTYTLTAKGAGGSQTATAQVTVNAPPPPPPPPPAQPTVTDEELFGQNIKDIYFDYDKSDIRAADESAIQGDAAFLQQHPNINFTIEGHCDERGSTEYNLVLGDKRATSVKNALIAAGVSADRIKTVSLGKEKPFCTEHNEECWQQNRRGHFVYNQ